MSGKSTLRKRLTVSATASLMLIGANAQAQHGTQAVMTVTAHVISVPEFISDIVHDITDQLQEQRKVYSLGEHSIKFPKGSGYSVSFDPVIKMKGKNSSWDLNTSVDRHTDPNGKLTLIFTGKPTTPSVVSDHYIGELRTQIEYH